MYLAFQAASEDPTQTPTDISAAAGTQEFEISQPLCIGVEFSSRVLVCFRLLETAYPPLGKADAQIPWQ